jgi:hypothetical protein
VAAKVGFCGLDRKREPLVGDEVRACWVDGAVPAPLDPAIPGLLDLLTVAALAHPPADDRELAGADRRPQRPADDRPSRRLWVEVEAQPAEV